MEKNFCKLMINKNKSIIYTKLIIFYLIRQELFDYNHNSGIVDHSDFEILQLL
jgi:hypothetical protein